MGLGFPRFRGGPLRYIESLGLEVFASTIRRYAGLGALYEVPEGLAERIINSQKIL
ncbi:Fatty acid oxidation complex subunit alpha [compost metagenome]